MSIKIKRAIIAITAAVGLAVGVAAAAPAVADDGSNRVNVTKQSEESAAERRAAANAKPSLSLPCTFLTPCGYLENWGRVGVGISPENYGGTYKWILSRPRIWSDEYADDVARFYVGNGYLVKITSISSGNVYWAGLNGAQQWYLNDGHYGIEAKQCTRGCIKW